MFKLTKIEGGRINVFEPQKLPVVNNADIESGQALKLNTSGVLESAGSSKPTFIALSANYVTIDGVKKYLGEIAVGRVEPNQLYEVPVTAAPTSLKVGNKVTLSSGTGVTATTTDGVAEIVSLNGATAAGDTVIVRFS